MSNIDFAEVLIGLCACTIIFFFCGLKSYGERRGNYFVASLTTLIILIISLVSWSSVRFNPELERRILPSNSISLSQVEPGMYECLDVWEITPFYVAPIRSPTIIATGEERAVTTLQRKWTFLVFSAEDKKLGKVPPGRNEPLTFTSFLEVSGDSANRVCSVVKIP